MVPHGASKQNRKAMKAKNSFNMSIAAIKEDGAIESRPSHTYHGDVSHTLEGVVAVVIDEEGDAYPAETLKTPQERRLYLMLCASLGVRSLHQRRAYDFIPEGPM